MIWHDNLRKRIIAAQNHMTAFLAQKPKSGALQCRDALSA
jgi:hypothetical protein